MESYPDREKDRTAIKVLNIWVSCFFVDVVYHFLEEEQLDVLMEQCKTAFRLVHKLYNEPLKNSLTNCSE